MLLCFVNIAVSSITLEGKDRSIAPLHVGKELGMKGPGWPYRRIHVIRGTVRDVMKRYKLMIEGKYFAQVYAGENSLMLQDQH